MRIATWNVNGLRAIMKKGFKESLQAIDPDVIFLQEIKMQPDQLLEGMALSEMGYELIMHSAQRKGYSGVAAYTRIKPDAIHSGSEEPIYNEEGRVLRLDFGNLSIYGIYFPNGGRGEERMIYKMGFYEYYLKEFEELSKSGRHVIVCGDYNVAHEPIDLANPERNKTVSGFLPIEREWFTKLLAHGFVDIWRQNNPEEVKYTYWDQRFKARERNAGWRIDYFVVDEKTVPLVKSTQILNEYMGSDHCPLILDLKEDEHGL